MGAGASLLSLNKADEVNEQELTSIMTEAVIGKADDEVDKTELTEMFTQAVEHLGQRFHPSPANAHQMGGGRGAVVPRVRRSADITELRNRTL